MTILPMSTTLPFTILWCFGGFWSCILQLWQYQTYYKILKPFNIHLLIINCCYSIGVHNCVLNRDVLSQHRLIAMTNISYTFPLSLPPLSLLLSSPIKMKGDWWILKKSTWNFKRIVYIYYTFTIFVSLNYKLFTIVIFTHPPTLTCLIHLPSFLPSHVTGFLSFQSQLPIWMWIKIFL